MGGEGRQGREGYLHGRACGEDRRNEEVTSDPGLCARGARQFDRSPRRPRCKGIGMNRKSKGIVTGLAPVALAAGATFAAAQYGVGWRGHGMHRAGPSFRIGLSCGDGSRADRMLERLEERIKLTEAQKPSFEEFKTAAKTAAEKVKSGCPVEQARNMP